MTNSLVDTSVEAAVRAAADAAAGVLPSGVELVAGPAGRSAEVADGQAVIAHFTGSVSGELMVLVDGPVVAALAESPLGELDLTQALKLSLTAAAETLGPVALAPAQQLDAATAVATLLGRPGALIVPLISDGVTRAAVGLALTEPPTVADSGSSRTSQPLVSASVVSRPAGARAGMDLLHSVEMDVTAELGRTRMTLNELLSLSDGAVIELDRAAGAPADVLVNGRLIARGEVVVIDENFGLRITEIVADAGTR